LSVVSVIRDPNIKTMACQDNAIAKRYPKLMRNRGKKLVGEATVAGDASFAGGAVASGAISGIVSSALIMY
jgi:hypothetical protein